VGDDTDSYFDVALNGANDLSWYVGQGLVRNRSLGDAFGGSAAGTGVGAGSAIGAGVAVGSGAGG
jgi:hypothetical protein